jgi:lipopolysaccharide/colanic/teichoic acid biosynthesis glycosyltransferase
MKTYLHYVHNTPEAEDYWLARSSSGNDTIDKFRTHVHDNNELIKAILDESSPEVCDFISEHLDVEKYFRRIVFTTESKLYIENVDFSNVRSIINFKLINNIKHINEHFRSVNKLLPDAGIFIGRIETYWERKIRFQRKFGMRIGGALWLMDFAINRIIPKLQPLDKIYRSVTRKMIHVISQAEILGRLVYCGFEIVESRVIGNKFYFVVIKTKEPEIDTNPSYHPLIRLKRIGKNGDIIDVYKFRTMHPYSEYLQDYVLRLNGYNSMGKPANDFRVARWGRIFRKLWVDEFPQILNVLMGDMKIVGVRPLSRVRYNQFPEDLKAERIKYKPGCVPPYVALRLPDDKGNIEAERIYLKEYALRPFMTDIKYFVKAVYNILMNKIG